MLRYLCGWRAQGKLGAGAGVQPPS